MKFIKIDCKNEIYPKSLLQIPNYPKELYVLGNYELLNNKNKVAIIGSRDCTQYGRKYATQFAEELSKKDICIVSGMAIGIDTSAHIGAVENTRKNHCGIRRWLQRYIPKRKRVVIPQNTCKLWMHNNRIPTKCGSNKGTLPKT